MAIRCPHCRFENPDDTMYCGKCGKNLLQPESPQVSITKTLETPKEVLSAGSVFAGRYRVIEALGEGGMGMEAYELYLKGMHFIKGKYVLSFNEEDYQAGVEMFEKTLAIDPDYAPAYLGSGWAAEHHSHVTRHEEDALKVQKYLESYRI